MWDYDSWPRGHAGAGEFRVRSNRKGSLKWRKPLKRLPPCRRKNK